MPNAPSSSSNTKGPAQRKPMRKGTHSCFECRRRKIRCIFRPDESNICISCISRGLQCIEQRRDLIPNATEKAKSNLKQRVAKLEAIIEASGLNAQDVTVNQLSVTRTDGPHNLTENAEGTPILVADSDADKATPLPSSRHSGSVSVSADSPQEVDPVANIFNNAFWRRRSPDGNDKASNRIGITSVPVNTADPRILAKRSVTREALLSVLPPPELLGEILNATCSWWNSWKPLGPWLSDSATSEKPQTLQDFVLWALGSEDPSIVGLGILAIAVSIQQLDRQIHEHIISRLRRPAGELFHDCFESVDSLIVNDSEYASSREGIEVILMSGKLLMNFGLLKKCWVLNHRAGSYAQLLGLHRPQRLFRNESDEARTRRHRSWLSICQADALLSLLLGLPYYADARTIPTSVAGEPGSTWFFQFNLISLSARVIDRNQMGSGLSLTITLDIQRDLDSLAGQVDQDFWDVKGWQEQGRFKRDEYFERVVALFWYHLVKVYLHMPLLIQSLEDSRLGAHREVCLEACRDLLLIYHIMRSDSSSAFNMVKVIDYEAFICSALLLLGMMGYGSHQSLLLNSNKDLDRDVVLHTLSILRETSTTSNNTIAAEAVQGLESLTSLAKGDCCPGRGENGQDPYAQIVVPYSGTITISPGTFFTNKRTTSENLATNPPPVFTLSHDLFQAPPNQSQARIPADTQQNSFEGFDANNSVENGNFLMSEYPSIDFDWGSMVNVNIEEDWAWLMDLNSNGLNGIL